MFICGYQPDEAVRLLLDLGLTQGEIASRAQISQPSISRILNGNTKDVRLQVAKRLNDLVIEEHRKVKPKEQ